MNNEFVCLPSLPSLPSACVAATTVFQVVTPYCHKEEPKQDVIIPLPEVAEKIEPPKQAPRPEVKRTPVPAKKLEKIKKKFDGKKAKTDHHWLPGKDEKTRPITAAKPAPKKFDKAPIAKVKAKAKPVAKKPVAKPAAKAKKK